MKPLIVAALIVMPAPVLAAESGGQTGAAEPQQERLICRRMNTAAPSGTRMQRRRVCLTAAQWRQRSDAPVDDAVDLFETRTKQIEMPGHRATPG